KLVKYSRQNMVAISRRQQLRTILDAGQALVYLFAKLIVPYHLDYYNNRRIKVKLKGLPPAVHRQQALSVT
ncbi:IS3 family transposase, partial [uncultured Subdoligranulum sp.]|uniref:IS3 family transposase n=1 Tax=uncultured Subdoligranulum sp. TaxID=512298 RepID=UPI00345BBA75